MKLNLKSMLAVFVLVPFLLAWSSGDKEEVIRIFDAHRETLSMTLHQSDREFVMGNELIFQNDRFHGFLVDLEANKKEIVTITREVESGYRKYQSIQFDGGDAFRFDVTRSDGVGVRVKGAAFHNDRTLYLMVGEYGFGGYLAQPNITVKDHLFKYDLETKEATLLWKKRNSSRYGIDFAGIKIVGDTAYLAFDDKVQKVSVSDLDSEYRLRTIYRRDNYRMKIRHFDIYDGKMMVLEKYYLRSEPKESELFIIDLEENDVVASYELEMRPMRAHFIKGDCVRLGGKVLDLKTDLLHDLPELSEEAGTAFTWGFNYDLGIIFANTYESGYLGAYDLDSFVAKLSTEHR